MSRVIGALAGFYFMYHALGRDSSITSSIAVRNERKLGRRHLNSEWEQKYLPRSTGRQLVEKNGTATINLCTECHLYI